MNIEDLSNEIQAKEERLKTTNIGAIKKIYDELRRKFEFYNKDMMLSEIISNPTRIRSVNYNIKKICKRVHDMKDIISNEISINEAIAGSLTIFGTYDNIESLRRTIEDYNQLLKINDILEVIRGETTRYISRWGNHNNDISIEQFIDIVEISELLRELKYHIFDKGNEQLISKHNDMIQAINQIIGVGTINNYVEISENIKKVPAYERMKAFIEYAKIQVVK